MVVPNLADPFSASAVQAVQQVARKNGHVVVLTSSGGDEALEREELETLVRRQVDGLIIAPADGNFGGFIKTSITIHTGQLGLSAVTGGLIPCRSGIPAPRILSTLPGCHTPPSKCNMSLSYR